MNIVAVHNIKGGVGKTTTSVNLAWEMAREGWRVLLWDLDPQGATSFYLRIQSKVKGGGKRLLKGQSPLLDHVKETNYPGLELLPADFSYRNLDLYLNKHANYREYLAEMLAPLEELYDFIVLDCPPSFSRLSESVYHAADKIVVPVLPSTLAVRTLNQISDYCEQKGLPEEKLLPFFSMVDRQNPNHQLIVEKLPPRRQKMLVTKIPLSTRIEAMSLQRAPIGELPAAATETAIYRRFWKEIEAALGMD